VSSSIFERHPDQDALADLAAEVLPEHEARTVEAHVIGCRSCAQLLADAERVRRLLVNDDPGPMPDDVWLRIERSITAAAAEAAAGRGRPGPPPPPPPILPPIDDLSAPTLAFQRFYNRADDGLPGDDRRGDDRRGDAADGPNRLDRADGADPSDADPSDADPSDADPSDAEFSEADPSDAQAGGGPVPLHGGSSPLLRPGSRGKARRSHLPSRHDVRPGRSGERRLRPGILMAAAAAGLVVVGAGGLGIRAMTSGGNDQQGASIIEALPGASGRSLVTTSGVNYRALTLPEQVKALLGRVGNANLPASRGASASVSRAADASSPFGGSSASSGRARAGTLADPGRLQACLGALGESDRRPLAVDLARYEGREAAVIVLLRPTGGYDVWVVARDCRPGAEGGQAFRTVPA
jgi:hypothetical protein